ncbi:hypothetical protein MLGJGCBP_02321 [Rhodococcus sp. T7]|nr:hypothetical protein MLGJGCBP_02321 [Rhodococcus sp. T7]
MLEHISWRQDDSGLSGPRHQLDGHDAVAAQSEERIVDAHLVESQDVGEDRHEHAFDIGGRHAARCSCSEVELWQRVTIDLAVRCQGERGKGNDRGGNHVGRQGGREMGDQLGTVEFGSRCGYDVTDQVRGAVGVLLENDNGLRDTGMPEQGVLDFSGFDPVTVQLHLEVAATPVLELSTVSPPGAVAGAVHPRPGCAVRIRHETRCGQWHTFEIASGQLLSGDVQIADSSGRHRVQATVEDIRAGIPHRRPDRHDRVLVAGVDVDVAVGDRDGGFGGTVHVAQSQPELEHLGRCPTGDCFTAGEDAPERSGQSAPSVVHEHREHRRNELDDGDLSGGQRGRQVVEIEVTVGPQKDQDSTGTQGRKALPDSYVEGDRRLLDRAITGAERQPGSRPSQLSGDRGV